MVAKNESNTADRELVISRVIHFPRQRVWEAMTDPRQVVQWWGPRGFTTTIDKMDFKIGGTWRYVMRGPDGTEYANKSVFTEIEEPERIVYVHGGCKEGGPAVQFVATWTFEALGESETRLTIRQVYPSPQDRDTAARTYGVEEGARQCLTRLAETVIRDGQPFVIERTYPQSISQVWRAITDPGAIETWFFDFVGFKPEPGNEFSFVVEHEGNKHDHRCQVTEVVPERKIAFTWRYAGFSGDSLVTMELSAIAGGTRLKLTHDGLDHFPRLPQFDRSKFEKGWTGLIGSELPNYLAGTPA
jgi:uncharacterized protein YndB with AHSA1/START domain